SSTYPPTRLRRFLWLLCINGALLALQGIIQRLDGTGKLLWVLQPQWNKTSDLQFGAFAYRSNAAQYFNLVWPVCLGFWWVLRQAARKSHFKTNRVGEGPHLLLIPCAVLMAACPVISSSRGGAFVAMMTLLPALVVLVYKIPKRERLMRWGMISVFGIMLV